jgi:hypothetical protein
MTAQGFTVKTVTAKQIIHKAPFVRGFKEVQYGIPMDYDAYCDSIVDREGYERGRMFGQIYKGPLKYGKKVTNQAQSALCNAFYTGSLI